MPGYLCGRAPKNKGMQFPADPPRVEEIIAVMRAAGASAHSLRMRRLIAVLWRAGLRISEALALTESDVDPRRGGLLVGGHVEIPVSLRQQWASSRGGCASPRIRPAAELTQSRGLNVWPSSALLEPAPTPRDR